MVPFSFGARNCKNKNTVTGTIVKMSSIKYTAFEYDFGGLTQQIESYSYMKLPYFVSNKEGASKILYVLDYVPQEDLRGSKLLSGVTGQLLSAVVDLAKSQFMRKEKVADPGWMCCTFNAFRTAGKPAQFQQAARDLFKERLESLICRYKPDVVMVFGVQPIRALIGDKIELSGGKIVPWTGVPIPKTFKAGKQSHSCKVVCTASLNAVITGDFSEASCLGIIAKHVSVALRGGVNKYLIDHDRIMNHTSVYIDTLKKYKKLMAMIRQQPVVAVDTEANNLNRVTNKLLTVQFSKCQDYGYLIPFYHKDTPFTSKELSYIKGDLRAYFEGDNESKYHVYANAQFDLSLLRDQLDCSIMMNDAYDIFGGAYAADENYKFFGSMFGDYYYSLGNLTIQHGSDAYLTSEFGKKMRGSIYKTDMTAPLIRYCTFDTVIPYAIHEMQLKEAQDIGHTKFESIVAEQLSDQAHMFSKMESTGSGVDIKYLFHLKSPASPIEKEIKLMEDDLLKSDSVKEANTLLAKSKGVPTKGLFPSVTTNVFSFRKDEHKQLLFFDVLKLEPLDKGGSGNGKLDKKFQSHYSEVPEVAKYTALGKARKLKNAYVTSFIKLLGTSEDFKFDHRIRPQYQYLGVVTGRTSARNPNLQQIPARSELGKHIKRLFVAKVGTLYIKVDYRVHEVRGWGLISSDKGVADVFLKAREIRDEYRRLPTEELSKMLKTHADIHIMNASYFFGIPLTELDKLKEVRNDVKAVIFGLIYQMSVKTLAGNLGKTLEFTKDLVKNFNKRFPSGMKWIEHAKAVARKTYFFENPFGMRRHLWGYLLPKDASNANKVAADCDRRAVNSPIQGMCSQMSAIGVRMLDKFVHKVRIEENRELGLDICNAVHDSLETLSQYETLLENIDHIERSLTVAVREEVYRRHGFKFVVDPEIDMEIGSSLSNCKAWDNSIAELERLVFSGLMFQKHELNHKVDVKAVMHDIFVRQFKAKTCPKWLKIQAKNLNWSYSWDRFKEKYEKGEY